MTSSPLRRELGTPALVLYGVGGMLGGGIYALVGEVAGLAGGWAWLSFALAMAVAAPTALTYSELAARHPRSGGEARYCQVAFGGEALPQMVGWMVLFSGIVSMAALSHAFAGYVREIAPAAPTPVLTTAFLAGLAVLNLRGIRLASAANIACTAIEASGLAAVIALGAWSLTSGAPAPAESAVPVGLAAAGVLQGAALAFYAFIGFEDMVNVAEEVRRPRRSYALAVPLALVVVGAFYVLVVSVATAAVPPGALAKSKAPLTLVVIRATDGVPASTFTLVAVFAVANTALLNFVTASRLLYGMASQGLGPEPLTRVLPEWRTPHYAVGAVLLLALGLAVSGGLGFLAGTTSFLLLLVFSFVNLALLRIRRGESGEECRGRRVPAAVPVLGVVLSLALVAFLPVESVLASLGLVAAGAVAIALRRISRRR